MKIEILKDCPIVYNVAFFISKSDDEESLNEEFDYIFKQEPGLQWFPFLTLEAAKEFLNLYIELHPEFQHVMIIQDIFESEEEFKVINSEVVWACDVINDKIIVDATDSDFLN